MFVARTEREPEKDKHRVQLKEMRDRCRTMLEHDHRDSVTLDARGIDGATPRD
jgi:hypothetical protein